MPLPLIPLLKGLTVLTNSLKLGPTIRKHWKIIGILMLLGMIGVKYYSTSKENTELHEQLAVCKNEKSNELATYHERLASLQSIITNANNEIIKLQLIIDKNNAKIDELAAASKKLKDNVVAKQKELIKIAEKYDKHIQQILQEATPQTCEESIEYLKNGAMELQWETQK